MPSPIAHSVIGYVVYRVIGRRTGTQYSWRLGSLPRLPILLLATVGLSLLPDVDSILGILSGDFGRYHNNITHSLFVGFAVALIAGGMAWLLQRYGFWQWFLIALVSYNLHVIMDFFTVSRGVMALWPLTADRFLSPVPLFYGLHWSDGLISIRHLWTAITELAFALVLIGFTMIARVSAGSVQSHQESQQLPPAPSAIRGDDSPGREG